MPSNTSKYNAKRHETIVNAIREGNTRTTAFKLAGMNADTVFEWLRFAKDRPDDYPYYVKLLEDIIAAEAEFEASRVAIVKTAGDTGTWQAAAWWLERRKSADYGRHDKVAIGAGDGGPLVQLNQVVLADAEARENSRALLRRVTAGRAELTERAGVGDESSEEGAA